MAQSYAIGNISDRHGNAGIVLVHDSTDKTVYRSLLPRAPDGAALQLIWKGELPVVGTTVGAAQQVSTMYNLAPAMDTSCFDNLRVKPEVRALLCQGEAPEDIGPAPCEPLRSETLTALQQVLDMRHDHVPEAAGAVVTDFDRYVLPPGDAIGYLEKVNGTERDRRLTFDEDTHTYTLLRDDGTRRPTNGSVTYLAHKYETEFEPERVIAKMRRSKNWPRIQYCHGTRSVCPYKAGDRVGVVFVDASNVVIAAVPVVDMPRVRSSTTLYTYDGVMEDRHIRALWALKGHRTSNRGTEAHYQIERFMNRDQCHMNTVEFASFADFATDVMIPMQMKAYRTEWRIFCEDTNVAGSVDYVGVLPSGDLAIVDWKRSDKLRAEATEGVPFYTDKMKTPMDHLPCSATAGYALQLSLYKHIIEKHYGRAVSCLILVQIGENPFYTFVPPLELEADFIMAARRHENCVAAGGCAADQSATADDMARCHARLLELRRPWDAMVGSGAITLDGFLEGAVNGPLAHKRQCGSHGSPFAGQPEELQQLEQQPLFGGGATVGRPLAGVAGVADVPELAGDDGSGHVEPVAMALFAGPPARGRPLHGASTGAA